MRLPRPATARAAAFVLAAALGLPALAACSDDGEEASDSSPVDGNPVDSDPVDVYRDFVTAVEEDDEALFEEAVHPSFGTDTLREEESLAHYLHDLHLGASRDMLVLPDEPSEEVDVEDAFGSELDAYLESASETFGVDDLGAEDLALFVLAESYDRALNARSSEECDQRELPIEECIDEPSGELVDLNLVMVRDDDRWRVVFTEPA